LLVYYNFPNIDSVCETWSQLDGHCLIDMDLYYFVQIICSFAQFFRLPFFLKYQLLWSVIVAPSFLVFSHEVLMDEICLCAMACQSAINGMLRNISLLNTRLPGLLPKVECTPDGYQLYSIYSFVLAICPHICCIYILCWQHVPMYLAMCPHVFGNVSPSIWQCVLRIFPIVNHSFTHSIGL
jgi:hypothetical protein